MVAAVAVPFDEPPIVEVEFESTVPIRVESSEAIAEVSEAREEMAVVWAAAQAPRAEMKKIEERIVDG